VSGTYLLSPAGELRELRFALDEGDRREVSELDPCFLTRVESSWDGRTRSTRLVVYDRAGDTERVLDETTSNLETLKPASGASPAMIAVRLSTPADTAGAAVDRVWHGVP
jgi:hypothetical protein